MSVEERWLVVFSTDEFEGEVPNYYGNEEAARRAFESLKRTEQTITLWAQKITRVTKQTTEDLDW